MTLALVPDQAERYSTFLLGGEHYAVPEGCIRETLHERPSTHVAAAPRFMRGAIQVGGRPVPVVDLGSRLGQAFRSTAARTGVLVVEVQREGHSMLLGLTIDSFGAPGAPQPEGRGGRARPSASPASSDSFIAGMGRHGEGLVLLLDVDRILSTYELRAAEEFAACAELPQQPGSHTGLRSV